MRSILFVSIGLLLFAVVFRERGKLPILVMPLWVQSTNDVSYGPYPDNRVDILRPRWNGRSARPAVVVFHGGAWAFGSRTDMLGRVCLLYLRKGFVVANVEYRRGSLLPAIEDARRALEWFFAHAEAYGADRTRVVVTGESAGANLALLAAFQSKVRPAAVVNFYGITDVQAMSNEDWIRRVLPRQGADAAARLASPVAYVSSDCPPVFSVHGTADRVVPVEQTRTLTERIRNAGGDPAELFIPEGGHGFAPEQQRIAYVAVFQFLQRHRVLRD